MLIFRYTEMEEAAYLPLRKAMKSENDWERLYSDLLARKCSDIANITNPTTYCQGRYNWGSYNSLGGSPIWQPYDPQQESGLWQEWNWALQCM